MKLPLFVRSIGSWTKRSFGFVARNAGWFEDCFILPFIGGIRLACAAWTLTSLALTYALRGNETIERVELNLSRREFRAFDGETCEAHKISILKDENDRNRHLRRRAGWRREPTDVRGARARLGSEI